MREERLAVVEENLLIKADKACWKRRRFESRYFVIGAEQDFARHDALKPFHRLILIAVDDIVAEAASTLLK